MKTRNLIASERPSVRRFRRYSNPKLKAKEQSLLGRFG